MRKHLPLLLILVAVGLGYWLLASEEDEPSFDYDEGSEVGTAPDLPTRLELEVDAEAAKRRIKKKRRAIYQATDPRKLPKGVLVVRPLGPDLKPLIDARLQIILTPIGQRSPKLTVADEATGEWRFERVIAGAVELRVTGDHIVGRTVRTTVKRDTEAIYELHLEYAGAVKYDVSTYAKTRPAKVLLELFDLDGRPTAAWFQERGARKLTQARKVSSLAMGPEGVMFGIRPGRYRVKVTNVESEEWDDAEVDVVAGKTLALSLTVRR